MSISKQTVIVVTPSHVCDAGLAIAACRAGAVGILDLTVHASPDARAAALQRLSTYSRARQIWGVRWDAAAGDIRSHNDFREIVTSPLAVLVLAGVAREDFGAQRKAVADIAEHVLLEVTDLAAAEAAAASGFDGVIAKGFEASGRVGEDTSLMLVQRLRGRLKIPYWIQGGIGLHTAPAARLGGASGVVLREQLWLLREAPFGQEERDRWRRTDGSQTRVAGHGACFFRFFRHSAQRATLALERHAGDGDAAWHKACAAALAGAGGAPCITLGQDIGHAARYARRYATVGGVVTAVMRSMARGPAAAQRTQAFAPHSALAARHGTRYPIVQGPMAHVSDEPAFARSIVEAGALPFLALGVKTGPEIEALLSATQAALGDRPWGVGLLGFLPADLRREQVATLGAYAPRYAIISGGRPDQAAALEKQGISTYLHIPSPALLAPFLKDGARKFVLEGCECGGHVGPRTSWVLWDAAIEQLLEAAPTTCAELQVLFAGGIHDALSGAMAATTATALCARGAEVGVLMGTAYLFTEEAVRTGAITADFQKHLLACKRTVLLESGPGLASRCAESPFSAEFTARKRELSDSAGSPEDVRLALESLCIGRLRLASKGAEGTDQDPVSAGMYMTGQAAVLSDGTQTVAGLHADVSEGSRKLLGAAARAAPRRARRRTKREDIAIIGIACLYPEAAGMRAYWQNILNRLDTIREVDPSRWDPALYFDADRGAEDKAYSKWGGFLGEFQFDPLEYGIPPATLPFIEPIQLLTLQTASCALRDAGYATREFPRERTSLVFAAGQIHDYGIHYAFRTMLPHYLSLVAGVPERTRARIMREIREQLPRWTEDSFPGFLANVNAGRVANRLDLGGSSAVIDAACASSLAALDYGIRQLRAHDCDMALIGAVDGSNHPVAYLSFCKTHALSPRGRARPFDDSADGTVISEGIAVIVAKRLADAERDGDRIYALIKGIGSSSDGRNRSLTAPDEAGQILCLRRAYERAGLAPENVELIEAHGTGTTVGDKVEIQALTTALGGTRRTPQTCALGSVKSMIGHSKTAAGMAGLIKCALGLKHRILPPTIGVERPNSLVDFEKSPFYINTEPRPWVAGPAGAPRRAGVSAFGFGGTNFHVVLEEYRDEYRAEPATDLTPRSVELLSLHAPDRAALRDEIARLAQELAQTESVGLGQLAFSALVENRAALARQDRTTRCRLAIAAGSVRELKEKLAAAQDGLADGKGWSDSTGLYYGESEPPGSVCFLFPGQGSQRTQMLRALALSSPEALDLLGRADAILGETLDRPLSRCIYPITVFTDSARARQQAELNATRIAQPAMGVADLIVYELLMRYGIRPDIVAGHSYGEYVALHAAGCLSREDLLRVSALRGALVTAASDSAPGAMAAVQADGPEVEALISRLGLAVSAANFNAPDQTIVAGPSPAVDGAVAAFQAEGLQAKRIAVTAAFHTEAMSSAADKLRAHLRSLDLHAPRLPVYGNATAAPYPTDAARIPDLLARHMVAPIRFVEQLRQIHDAGARIFIESGPGRVLGNLTRRVLGDRPHVVLSAGGDTPDGWQAFAHALARLDALGVGVQMENWFDRRGFQQLTLARVFEAARAKANPAPTIWRVSSSYARPWREKAPTPPAARPPSPDPTERPDRDPAVLARVQANTTEFLQLQREQQELMRRFLTLQERMLGTQAPVPATQGPAPPDPAARPTALGPAPVPNLPKLRVRPSAVKEGWPTAVSPAEQEPAPVPDPPAAVAAGPARDPADPAGALPTVAQFEVDLLRTVSERTGYPVEMLDMAQNLEADLGIDSIKMVEIFSSLREHHELLQAQDGDRIAIEEVSALRTLRDIVRWYERNRAAKLTDEPAVPAQPPAAPAAGVAARGSAPRSGPNGEATRHVLKAVCAPLNGELAPPSFPADDLILVAGQSPKLGAAIHGLLAAAGYTSAELAAGKQTRARAENRYEIDLSAPDAAARLRALIREAGKRVGGIINLPAPSGGNGALPDNDGFDRVKLLFVLVQAFAADLAESAARGGGWLLSFSSIDGRFGLHGGTGLDLGQAACIGFLKSVAKELPDLKVQCIDIASDLDPDVLTTQVARELGEKNGAREIGFSRDGRWELTLEERRAAPGAAGPPILTSESVLLATGGACGITAVALQALAARYKPTILIVGRSPMPGPEPAATADCTARGALRERLIAHARQTDGQVTPAAIERRLATILKNRAIRTNIQRMRDSGARVTYRSLDVRETDKFAAFIDEIYEKHGRIDGVLHGAGVLDDKLLGAKNTQEFETVYKTKVAPAIVLAHKLRPEKLSFTVFFSSVVGRFGNVAQSDYSAANEALNKLADLLDRRWPSRVVAINWGPWDSGMVSDGLRNLYAERGIALISEEEGARCFEAELGLGNNGPAEVVITRSLAQIAGGGSRREPPSAISEQ